MRTRAAELIESLSLRPHPEGGHFKEIFRSPLKVRHGARERSALTTIYYLLQHGEVSRWHVVAADEAWHFYEGDGLELITYQPETRRRSRVVLAPATRSAVPVHVVPAGCWQAARPLGRFCLAGCTVAPGFEFEDFRLVADLPDHGDAVSGELKDDASLL